MNVPELVHEMNGKARGRYQTLRKTSNRYQTLASLASSLQQKWAGEPGEQWESLRRDARIGPITAAAAFPTPDIRSIGQSIYDHVRIEYTLNQETQSDDYRVVEPGLVSAAYSSRVCAFYNRQVVFPQAFKNTDKEIGGFIIIPNYIRPQLFTAATADSYQIQVDNPWYLVYRGAAEIVAAGYTKEERSGEFFAEARRLMDKMKEDNRAGQDEIIEQWRPAGRSDY